MIADFPDYTLGEYCEDSYFKLLDFLEAKKVNSCYVPAVTVNFCILRNGLIVDIDFRIPVYELSNMPSLELKIKSCVNDE